MARSWRGGRFPKLEEIVRGALGEIWNDCYVLDISETPDDARFKSIGQDIAHTCDEDFASSRVSDIPKNTLLHQSTSQAAQVLEKLVPISMGGKFEYGAGLIVLFRSILLPLSDNKDDIHLLLGAANSRVLAEN